MAAIWPINAIDMYDVSINPSPPRCRGATAYLCRIQLRRPKNRKGLMMELTQRCKLTATGHNRIECHSFDNRKEFTMRTRASSVVFVAARMLTFA